MFKNAIIAVCAVLFVASAANAQTTAVPGQKFAWDQPATDLATANGYTYKYYLDGATTGVAFTGVVCTGTASPFKCEVLIPAFTPGNHSLTATASIPAGESVKSSPALNFTVVIILPPINFTIKGDQ